MASVWMQVTDSFAMKLEALIETPALGLSFDLSSVLVNQLDVWHRMYFIHVF